MSQPVRQVVNLGDMRIKYKDRSEVFTEEKLSAKEPIGQFDAWFKEATACKEIIEPNAICLATASKDGTPRCRFVLLKGYSDDGFRFFTNFNSQKGKDLEENPKAAFTIYWQALRRQVRVEGRVEKLNEAAGLEYFNSRPFDSRINCIASDQSSVVPSREYLVERSFQVLKEHPENPPKPSNWGGYLVVPEKVEFWQGQSDRLHDRIVFRRPRSGETPDPSQTHQGDAGWLYERLAP